MAQPSSPPSPTTPSAGPPPPYWPYPPYPAYPYYPPQRDNTLLIVVIVVVIVVLILPTVIGVVLYMMVSGLISETPEPIDPQIFLGPVDQRGGTATIQVFITESMVPTDLRFSLFVNGSGASNLDLPPPDESVEVVAGGYALRVSWIDRSHDRLVSWEEFVVARDAGPLPSATTFEFTLQASDGSFAASTGWTTP